MVQHADSAKNLMEPVWWERHSILSAYDRTTPRLPNQDICDSSADLMQR